MHVNFSVGKIWRLLWKQREAAEKVKFFYGSISFKRRIRNMLRFPWVSVKPPRALPISYLPQESTHIPDAM